ncbi:Imm42 family immunity protein [Photorhabdus sp. CRCIA-P01]
MEIIMIFGDPNHFAILIEYLSDWSTESGYSNGINVILLH